MATWLVLDEDEIVELTEPVVGQGGFQTLMRKLQEQFRPQSQELRLDDEDLEAIRRYGKDYQQGGFEDRLKGVFERHLGSDLDKFP